MFWVLLTLTVLMNLHPGIEARSPVCRRRQIAKHYGEDCTAKAAHCIGPGQICSQTTGRCDCKYDALVYNATENKCGLPCMFTYYTTNHSGRQYKYGGDNDPQTMADAQQICRQDGGYLLTLLKFQDEFDYAYFKFESGQSMDQKNWINIEQLNQFEYWWHDVNITMVVDSDTAESYDGKYAHFVSMSGADRYTYDTKNCFNDEGMDDGYAWDDALCTATKTYVCECPSMEKYEEVFVKGNKDYLLDPESM